MPLPPVADSRALMRGPARALTLAAVGLFVGCRTPTPKEADPVPSIRPRLVVSIVLDQLGTWALEQHFALLPEDGLLKRIAEQGVYYPRVLYPYGATITAAGHATINTGVPPRVHGVVANDLYDPIRGEKRALVDDGKHELFGADGYASPVALGAPTVADRLKQASGGRAKVVSISIKDRGAVLPGGQKPDFVAFYRKSIPGFTTSTFYVRQLPTWFVDWCAAHPVEKYLRPWTALPVTRTRATVPDDRPVESSIPGFGRTFPHDPKKTRDPASILRFMPAATAYQIDLARAAVAHYRMGEDEVPDLLAFSVSATDYVGHMFGAESWEFLDNLIRTDRMLGAWIRELEQKTSVAVLVTSDHGQAPVSTSPAPPRIFPSAVVRALDTALAQTFGKGSYAGGYHLPYVYLSREALAHPRKAAIRDALIRTLEALPGVELAVATETAAGWRKDDDPLRRAIAEGIDLKRAGPIYVLPKEGVIVDPSLGGGGTTHGTPYAYDREVPVLVLAPSVNPLRSQEPQDILRLAATLSALLGISPPPQAAQAPLPGVRATANTLSPNGEQHGKALLQ